MPTLPPIPDETTFRLYPNLPDYGWFAGKRRDITVDRYAEAVSKLALWLDLKMLISVFKSLFGAIDVFQEFPDLVLII